MEAFQRATLTAYGVNRIAEAHDKELMDFTTIGLSDVIITGELGEVVTLPGEKQRFPITTRQVDGDTFWAECVPSDITDPEGIHVRSMGLYIATPGYEDDRGRDKLYSVATVIPDYGGGRDFFIHIPQNPQESVSDYKVGLHTIISPNALIVIETAGITDDGEVIGIASESALGLVRSGPDVVVDSAGLMNVTGLPEAIDALNNIQRASLDVVGITQLNNAIDSTDETLAATPRALNNLRLLLEDEINRLVLPQSFPMPNHWMQTVPGIYSFMPPAGVTEILVTACGGGQGGASAADGRSSGGAGAAAIFRQKYSVTPGIWVHVTLGAGGMGFNEGVTTNSIPQGYPGAATIIEGLVTLPGGANGLPGGPGGGIGTPPQAMSSINSLGRGIIGEPGATVIMFNGTRNTRLAVPGGAGSLGGGGAPFAQGTMALPFTGTMLGGISRIGRPGYWIDISPGEDVVREEGILRPGGKGGYGAGGGGAELRNGGQGGDGFVLFEWFPPVAA